MLKSNMKQISINFVAKLLSDNVAVKFRAKFEKKSIGWTGERYLLPMSAIAKTYAKEYLLNLS